METSSDEEAIPETMGLTKTMMTYNPGELVLYDDLPYLVKNLQPKPLRLVLTKIGGGGKRVDPRYVTSVPDVGRKIFKSVEDIPYGVIRKYLPDYVTFVGSRETTKKVFLERTDLSAAKICLKPLGNSSETFVNKLAAKYKDLVFSKNPLSRVRVPIVVTLTKPSPKKGYIQKHLDTFKKSPISIIVYVCNFEVEPGFTADPEAGSLLEFEGGWIFQVKSLDDVPEDVEKMILGLTLSRVAKKKLEIPK